MTKRLLTLSMSMFLLLSSQAYASHAAVKAGSKCSKVGTKSVVGKITYTCIKSGKNTIWKKGVTSPSVPSPNPSPSPTNSSKEIFGSPEQTVAYENMKQAMVPQPVPQLFRFHYSPNALKSFKDRLEFELTESMKYWWSVYSNTELFNVFYGTETDLDWLIQAWTPYGFDKNKGFAEDFRGRIQREGNQLNAGAVPSQADASHLSILRHSSLANRDDSFLPHENVHIVQQYLTKNQTQKMPCWLREGSANLFGNFIVAEKYGASAYNSAKRGDMNNYLWGRSGVELRAFNQNEWFTHLKSLEGNFQGGCDYLYRFAYGSGLLLSELLMSEYGFDKMMNFWRAFALEKDWRLSFNEIYGVSIDTWYSEKAIPYLLREYSRVRK
jgi:hypothetical protein